MELRQIGVAAIGIGAVLSMLCVYSNIPDAHAVILGSGSVNRSNIGTIALCGAPFGFGFILAFIAAAAG